MTTLGNDSVVEALPGLSDRPKGVRFLSIVIILASLFKIGCGEPSVEKSPENLPACVNLRCYDNSDCGKRCFCEPQSNSTLGVCRLKS